ncbi:MAG: ABC transporter ATP-binding protein [Lachnospiraceae bacterium]
MELNLKLPAQISGKLSLKENETICYCSLYDISSTGEKQEFCYLAVTNERLLKIGSMGIVEEVAVKDIETLKCEPQVGQGILVLKRKGRDYEELFARFSMKHVNRIAYLARGAVNFRDGITKKIISTEVEKTCPVCGTPMRGRSECPKCNGSHGVVRKFIRMCAAYKLQLFFIAVCMLMVSATSLIRPKIQQVFIDKYIITGEGGMKEILIFAAVMILITTLLMIFDMTNYWLCNRMGTSLSRDYRIKIYDKIQQLSMSYITDRKPGALMNRLSRDTNEISGFMNEAFSGMFSCIITMIAAVIVMLSISVKLTIISVVFMPVALGISILFYKNIHRRFHMQWVKMDKTNSGLQDVLSGMRIVKSFGTEEKEAENFERMTGEFCVIQKRNERFWASLYPMLTFIMSMGVYAITYFGGGKVFEDELTIGQLNQLISYAWILYGPLEWMTFLPRRITQLITSLERIYDTLDEEPAIVDDTEPVVHKIEGSVELRNVRFGYHSYSPVLENINLTVKPGEMIGLVGASGTGKSTLINLLMRLYEVDDGAIYIDGINLNKLKISDYHSQLGIVLQENFLFAGTIYNNLKFAKPDASYEEIIRAAKLANAHDFIMKTPDGYNTYIGEHGYNLSGGERQRLSIARAVLNNPRILILDEATSNLDTESEYLIQKALERLREGCTTFAIAHRLSTLKDADRLVVIDGHNIAEVGTHNELMEKKGIYYGLVTAQLEMQKLN